MNTFDLTLFHWINHFAGHLPVLDLIMKWIAQYALEIYALLFVIAWFTLPKQEESKRHSLVVAGFAGILALLINFVISHIWYRSRPFVVLPQDSFTRLIPHSVDASFPSDHASGSFAFAAATWGQGPQWVSRTFTIFAVLVMISRIYVGVHWPTDVLASCVVGIVSARIMRKFSRVLHPLTQLGLRIFPFRLHVGKKGM